VAVTASVACLIAPGAANALAYDNTDPADSGCSSGGYTLTFASVRRWDTDGVVGTIELRWSPSCQTAWARFTPSAGVYPVFAVVDAIRPSDGAQTTRSVRNGTSWPLYGNQLSGATTCVRAEAYFTIDGPNGNLSASGQTGCGGPLPSGTTYAETTGSTANTWTNYTNAGGTQGPTIGTNATVRIACKLHGFQVPDGNTWWYRVASSPWNGTYYVSADAFYNDGQTSGSLVGTPYVDTNVPDC
jgi:Protein of unknown function (DUF2690)